ncbi:hypothetical protein SDRG_05886 [Saprolegnia diclina VS20]|uniref:SURF1-like protein n=1 Tax=Saprolegnia diclina (strain VS20) TaxID=1156394 RepID=T0QET6_SAPDV|nr:hypothetical protein SDRG_05886 [Saprolegnia diclina VS20]EQC36429.1 hypothetical protein SDRG_05886 [Saprolegnia diclina VS20]|eukprot:XP_008609850.1 hypothetical protein SDRG_05886 [Saprolegnia diclina VS20]
MQRGQLLGIGIFSSIVAGTASMGVWQSNRYFWKVDLIETRRQRLQEAPVPLPRDISAENVNAELEHRQLAVEGHFVPGKTFYLYPRSPPIDMSESKGKVSSGGFIYDLFERANGTSVIVNRGWLPKDEMEKHMALTTSRPPQVEAAPAKVQLVGVMVQGEEEKTFSPPNEPKKRHFFWLNQPELAHAMMGKTEYTPILLEEFNDVLTTAKSAQELVKKHKDQYLEFYMTPWKHAMYAGIWFSLALMGTGMVFYRFRSTAVAKKVAKKL